MPVLKGDEVSPGLPCQAEPRLAQIRPGDGRLLYLLEGALYQFNVDLGGVMASDTLIPTEACSSDSTHPLNDFRVSPTGRLYYRCASDWYDDSHQFVARIGGPVLQIGGNGTALTNGGVHEFARVDDADHDGSVLDAGSEPDAALEAGIQVDAAASDAGGPPSPVTDPLRRFVGLPSNVTVLASRVLPDGYLLALDLGSQSDQLWHVDFEGQASLVGSYWSTPSVQLVQSFHARLDPQGNLFQVAQEYRGTVREIVLRRSVDGENTTVWDELTSPRLKLNNVGYLVTGP